MATMLPTRMLDFDPASKEDVVFRALQALPDDYYVFHSFRMNHVRVRNTNKPILWEKEIDFLIYNQSKGILVLECKVAGMLRVVDGVPRWYYRSGIPMKHGGPFRQCQMAGKKLREYIEDCSLTDARRRSPINSTCQVPHEQRVLTELCPIHYAVCFPGMTRTDINALGPSLPPEENALPQCSISSEELLSTRILAKIENLYRGMLIEGCPESAKISDFNSKWLLEKVLFPYADLNLDAMQNAGASLKSLCIEQLIREQSRIAEFILNERLASVSGMAGTGKTFVAMELVRLYASGLADSGLKSKVLYLCFNKSLREFVEQEFTRKYGQLREFADFKTVDSFAGELAKMGFNPQMNEAAKYAFYNTAKSNIEGMTSYRHLVVDEGQDFSIPSLQASQMGDELALHMAFADATPETYAPSMVVFYDRKQIVAGRTWDDKTLNIPDFIAEADCKLTLHKNCRNTSAIATSAAKGVLKFRDPIVMASGVDKGWPFEGVFSAPESPLAPYVTQMIKKFKEAGCRDIVLVSCRPEGVGNDGFRNSCIGSGSISEKNGKYYFNQAYPLTTYRKFKGLDADGIILLDVGESAFTTNDGMVFYEGCSRAKMRLGILFTLTESEAGDVLEWLVDNQRIPDEKTHLRSKRMALLKALGGEPFRIE